MFFGGELMCCDCFGKVGFVDDVGGKCVVIGNEF